MRRDTLGSRGRQRPRTRGRLRSQGLALLFVGPALLITLAFTVYPLIQAFQLSFTQWDLLSPKRYVAGDNYAFLVGDPGFRSDVGHTLSYTVLTLVGTYVLALGTALLLNTQLKGIRWLRVASVTPVVLPMVVAGLIWKWLYEPQTGLLALTAELLTGLSPNWIYSPSTALPSIVVVGIWKEFGLFMLVFLIALQSINPSILEAAELDGATGWRRFWSITFPRLGRANTFVIVLVCFNSLKVFDQVWVMTRGGPGGATETILTFVYTNLQGNVGIASAASILLFAAGLVIGILRFRGGNA